jgi:hypothetical protein
MEAFERNVSHFNSLASVFFLCGECNQLEFVGNVSRYEAASHEATLATQREDFSDLVAEVNNTSPYSYLHVFFLSSDKQSTYHYKGYFILFIIY